MCSKNVISNILPSSLPGLGNLRHTVYVSYSCTSIPAYQKFSSSYQVFNLIGKFADTDTIINKRGNSLGDGPHEVM